MQRKLHLAFSLRHSGIAVYDLQTCSLFDVGVNVLQRIKNPMIMALKSGYKVFIS